MEFIIKRDRSAYETGMNLKSKAQTAILNDVFFVKFLFFCCRPGDVLCRGPLLLSFVGAEHCSARLIEFCPSLSFRVRKNPASLYNVFSLAVFYKIQILYSFFENIKLFHHFIVKTNSVFRVLVSVQFPKLKLEKLQFNNLEALCTLTTRQLTP